MSSYNLHKAKKAKNDEFYTQYQDIEKECQHYVEHFKDQWIYLPCDSEESNFWKYFIDKFKEFNIKHLTATHINLDGTPSYRLDYEGSEIIKIPLKGNGDFRSEECTKIKDECDIVITNPPFSLFRVFIKWLQSDTIQIKKFLIIGNMNAIAYKEIFPIIRDNKLWYGPSISSGDREFMVLESYPIEAAGWRIDEKGKKYIRVKGVRWFTNLDHKKRHKPIDLYKHYNEEEYPKYDNYDAINVNKVSDIPMDYDACMGVPISFLDKYCSEQFKIIDEITPYINGKALYKRLIIKKNR